MPAPDMKDPSKYNDSKLPQLAGPHATHSCRRRSSRELAPALQRISQYAPFGAEHSDLPDLMAALASTALGAYWTLKQQTRSASVLLCIHSGL